MGLAWLLMPLSASFGQGFGQNKIGYSLFRFKLQQTRNFELYNYLGNDSVSHYWARQSERWYRTHKQVLGDSIPFRNPVILYAHHADFQQTNVTPGNIDPGTGGFAEALKNRIVMPVMKANAQTNHVLGHEIAHAFQFQMLRHGDSLSVRNLMQLPLWFIEGMAEYLSIGPIDAHTALWMRDAVQHNALPTLNDLTVNPRFFPYRWGHAYWAYITGTYGEQVIRPLYLQAVRSGIEVAMQRVLGVSATEFNRQWHGALRQHYRPFASMPNRLAGVLAPSVQTSMQLAPAISPNGRYVAFLSEKNLFSIDLFLADNRTGRVIRKLLSTTRHAHLDALSYLESAGAWSPDGKLFGFVAFVGGRNRLVLVDVQTGRIRQEIEVPGVPAFSNPVFSPDGRHLVVSGLVNGQTDLYLYDLDTRQTRALTNDRYSELQPAFSPDGRTVVFVTDRPTKADDRPLTFNYHLALYDLPTQVTRVLDVFADADNLNPVFGADNQMVYFLSDRDGFRNLYAHNPYDNRTYQLTRFFTGITGITPQAPALSAARETGQLVFSVFERQGYRIHRADPAELLWERVESMDIDHTMATLPPYPRFNRDFVAARLNSTRPTNDPILAEPVQNAPFRDRFRITSLGNGSIGGTATTAGGRFGANASGGITATLGDLLGDRQIGMGLAVAGQLGDASGQVSYLNKRRRINWGVSLSHQAFRSGVTRSRLTTLEVDNRLINVVERAQDVERTFEQQLALFSYLPLSRTRRVELTGALARYSFLTQRSSEFFFQNRLVGTDQQRFNPNPAIHTFNLMAAYVGDNASMGPVGPLKGHRYRLSGETTQGPLQLHTVQADYRRYWRLRPVTFAARGLYVGRFGRDAQTGMIPPLFVGFPTLVRGYAINNFVAAGFQSARELSPNQLQGNQMAVANAEIRLSLTGPNRLGLFRSNLFPSELNLFADAGYAWWGQQFGPPRAGADAGGVWAARPILSTGVSARINLLGAVVLEPFWAVPWQLGTGTRGMLGLNLSAAW